MNMKTFLLRRGPARLVRQKTLTARMTDSRSCPHVWHLTASPTYRRSKTLTLAACRLDNLIPAHDQRHNPLACDLHGLHQGFGDSRITEVALVVTGALLAKLLHFHRAHLIDILQDIAVAGRKATINTP